MDEAILILSNVLDSIGGWEYGVINALYPTPVATNGNIKDDVEVSVEGPRAKRCVALVVREIVHAINVRLDVAGRPIDAVCVELTVRCGHLAAGAYLGANHMVELFSVDCGMDCVGIVANVFHDI